jgi:DNA-binding transcriptional LysR family regulator
MPDIDPLRTFIAVVDTGSLSRAARRGALQAVIIMQIKS